MSIILKDAGPPVKSVPVIFPGPSGVVMPSSMTPGQQFMGVPFPTPTFNKTKPNGVLQRLLGINSGNAGQTHS